MILAQLMRNWSIRFAMSVLGLSGPYLMPAVRAQQELNVPVARYTPTTWKAQWITHAGLAGGEPANVLFRRTVTLPTKPNRLIINVSADNKYTLYVNGRRVCFGPQLSDVRHWRYETIDIAPYLQAGPNVLAAEVVNFGPDRFFGMQSVRTAFLLNGLESAGAAGAEALVNTGGRNTWKVFWNKASQSRAVRWRVRPEDKDIVSGFYAANPTDSLRADAYPWDWQTPGFNDSAWPSAVFCESATAFAGGFAWLLEPRNTPLQEQRQERLASVAQAENVTVPAQFLAGTGPLTIPARTSAKLLIDHRVLTIGYPELLFTGGKDAVVRIGYAENLFLPNNDKGNRNELTGKRFVGIKDVLVTDGSRTVRTFRPTWLRTFRFVQLDITTADEPLTLRDFYNVYTTTPIATKARFSTDQPVYGQIFDICRRTAELCTQDYLLSDAYYETMQYVGDSKVHIPTWQALTGNELHTRNALMQFHYSRLWDGNLTSCYPLRSTFVHPTYSVIWVDMLWDYLLYSGDKAFIRPLLPGIRQTLDGFDQLMQPTGLAGKTRWDYFVDWYQGSAHGGLAPGQDGSNSAVVTLHYVYALQNAARLFDELGDAVQATQYRQRAELIRRRVYARCYDAKRGLMAERPTKDFFDQHTNIMAVLTDALPAAQQRPVLEKVLADTTLGQATYYYRFYLFEALQKAGMADQFDRALEPWKALIRDGLTTTPEYFESPRRLTRSECHPWSTAPASAYFSVVAGIRPASVGYKTVRIEPSLGPLTLAEGVYPHPQGDLLFRFEKNGTGLNALVTLPAGVSGTLVWQGKTQPLRPGRQVLKL